MLAFSFRIIDFSACGVISVGELFPSSAWLHKYDTSSLQKATHHIKRKTHPLLIATESKNTNFGFTTKFKQRYNVYRMFINL